MKSYPKPHNHITMKTKFTTSEPRPIGKDAFEVQVKATRGNKLLLDKTYCLDAAELEAFMDGLDKLNNEAQTTTS